MDASATSASSPKPRTARDRAMRRLRIFARLQEGWTHEAIAQSENLTRERVRQIVAETLGQREVAPSYDHARLQAARLEPALQLAVERVREGDLAAIDRLLRVLNQLDRYQSVAAVSAQDTDDDAAAFDAKLADLVERSKRAKAEAAARAEADAATTAAG